MLLFNVSINGGGNTATVSANDSFTISCEYYIQVCDSGDDIYFCQAVAGYLSTPASLQCIFRDYADCFGRSGSLTFGMKAPSYPAEYLIAFDLSRTLTVDPPCPTSWPHGAPVPERYIACINVSPVNVPVAVTGGVENVTANSATLHGEVYPTGSSTDVRFLLGTAPNAYTDSINAFESPITDSIAHAVSGGASGLSANTRYYYRLAVESQNGYNRGDEENFFTGPQFALAESTHGFGYMARGSSRTDSISVLNTGNMTLQVTSVISLSGQFAVSPANGSIPTLGTKKFAVTFSPPGYGVYSSGIAFFHGGSTSPDTQYVSGIVPIGSVTTGWNIVSVPLTVTDPRKSTIFPSAASNAFEFSEGYFPRDTLYNGRGYWLKFPAADSLVVTGDIRENETVPVTAGWNMIGGPSLQVPIDSVVTTPPGILAGNFFEYEGGYGIAGSLRPGKGYWVKTSQAGTLTLKGLTGSASGAAQAGPVPPEGSAGLTVTDSRGATQMLYAGIPGSGFSLPLPPSPPEGAFDARFGGDLFAASPEPGGKALPIVISGARYPVTLSWTAAGAEGMILSAGGRSLRLDLPGTAIVQGADEAVTIRAGARAAGEGAGIPAAAALTGSYPNPFNPATRIGFTLPSAGRIRISVYNALGEEVALLSDGVFGAGGHTVEFNAAGLPGGVYFCRMEAPGGVSSVKLLLVK